MTGPSITYEDVASIVAELKSTGQKISILAIRDKLGRGSFTTVKKHLARVQAENVPASSTPIPAQLESLWVEARRAADAELESDRAAVGRLSDELEARFETMRAAVAQATAAQALAETRLADRTAELERLIALSEDLRAQRNRGEEQLAAAEMALKEEREQSNHRWSHLAALLADLQNSVTQLHGHSAATADQVSASARALTTDLAEFASLERESRIRDQELLRRDARAWMAPFAQVPATIATVERNLTRLSRLLASAGRPQRQGKPRKPGGR